MFMFHENTVSTEASHFAKGWRAKRLFLANDLAELVSKHPNSPCLWSHGIRGKRHFKIAEWIGLDFDEGMTLEDAIKTFDEYLCVIGTTKSHGINKGGIVSDRFRVFLKLNESCINADDYEYTVKLLIKKYGADKACSDAGRFFWPCKKIVLVNYSGKVLPIADSREIVERRKQFHAKRKKESMELNGKFDTVPHHIKHKLRNGVSTGYSRNTACYQIGADLGCLNYSLTEIVELIRDSAIPTSKIEPLSLDEIEKAVRSGMKK